MATNFEYLTKVALFEPLPPETLQTFADRCYRKQIEKKVVLFEEGQVGDTMYVIVSGRVRVERFSENGHTQLLAIRTAGDIIGEMALTDGKTRSARIVALTKCRLLCLDRKDFQEIVLNDPMLAFGFMQTLSLRLRASVQMLMDVRSKDVVQRLHEYLSSLVDEEGYIQLDASQSTLADMLGCSRETVNRSLKALQDNGVIVQREGKSIRLTSHAVESELSSW